MTSAALREVFNTGRPLVEQWLDVAEQIAALRDVATDKGLDWSQVKALLKAQIQDERDESGKGKRVQRIVEKAEFASAYADMLGLAKMNENNFSADDEEAADAVSDAGPAEGQSAVPPLDTQAEEIHTPAQGGSEPVEAHNLDTPRSTRGPATSSHPAQAHSSRPQAGQPDDAIIPSVASSGDLSPSAPESPPAADLTGEAEVRTTETSPVSIINERCAKPDSCKYGAHPNKITCAACTTAWLLKTRAQREAEAA